MKNQVYLISILTLVIIIAISFFLIKPTVSTILASYSNLNKAQDGLKAVEERKNVLEELEKNSSLASVGEISKKYIPEEAQAGELVVELTAIAQSNSMKIEQTSMEESKTSKSSNSNQQESDDAGKATPSASQTQAETSAAKEVGFNMTLKGAYANMVAFLRAIESSSRLIKIKNIAVQSSAQTDKDGKPTGANELAFQITGAAYYKSSVDLPDTLDNIKVSSKTIQKFLNLKTYAAPIGPNSGEGFGRTDPFAGL